jgi:hypothetical protein
MSVDERGRAAGAALRTATARAVDAEARLLEIPAVHRRRRRSRAVGAAAVVGLAIAGVTWAGSSVIVETSPAPATPDQTRAETSAEQVANAYVQAHAGYDAERAVSYMSQQLRQDTDVVESLREGIRWLEAVDGQYLLRPCEQVSTDEDGTLVRCGFEMHAMRSEELGLGPFGDNWFILTVQDGALTSVYLSEAYLSNGFSEQVWVPFEQWLSEEYPEDAEVMYFDWPANNWASTDEEALRLWGLRTREFAATQSTQRAGGT